MRLAAAKDRDAAARTKADQRMASRELEAVRRAKSEADAARLAAAKELELATRAKADAEAARMLAAKEQQAVARTKADAEAARLAAARANADAESARLAMLKAQAESARNAKTPTRTAAAGSARAPLRVQQDVVVVEPPAASGPPRVRDIAFRGREGQGDVELALTGDARVTMGLVTKSYAELFVDGVELASGLERTKQDLTRFGSPLRNLTVVRDPRDPSRFYLRISLLAPATPSVRRAAGVLRWHFQGDDMP
jgi:hypothetical protein